MNTINPDCYNVYSISANSAETDRTRSETVRQTVSSNIEFDECLDFYKPMRNMLTIFSKVPKVQVILGNGSTPCMIK